jgi:hypothetical protein
VRLPAVRATHPKPAWRSEVDDDGPLKTLVGSNFARIVDDTTKAVRAATAAHQRERGTAAKAHVWACERLRTSTYHRSRQKHAGIGAVVR